MSRASWRFIAQREGQAVFGDRFPKKVAEEPERRRTRKSTQQEAVTHGEQPAV